MANPEYAEILSRHYPNPPYTWTISNNDLGTLQFSGGTTPTQAELDALWPGVEAVLMVEAHELERQSRFQEVYPLQRQALITSRAQTTGDTTELSAMLDFWDSL